MGEIDTFGHYVRQRLDGWGNEFALHRSGHYLGYPRKSTLELLREYGGEMPPRAPGWRPLDVDLDALQVESFVADIAIDQPDTACCLRGYWCGRGRRHKERYETAQDLIRIAYQARKIKRVWPLTANRYRRLVELGEAQVRGMLRVD